MESDRNHHSVSSMSRKQPNITIPLVCFSVYFVSWEIQWMNMIVWMSERVRWEEWEEQRKMCSVYELNSVMLTTAMSMTMTHHQRAAKILHLQIQITRKLLTFHPFYIHLIFSFTGTFPSRSHRTYCHSVDLVRCVGVCVSTQFTCVEMLILYTLSTLNMFSCTKYNALHSFPPSSLTVDQIYLYTDFSSTTTILWLSIGIGIFFWYVCVALHSFYFTNQFGSFVVFFDCIHTYFEHRE